MAEQFTHWKKLFNPDYLGSWAFEPGEEKVVTIGYVRSEMVVGADGKKEECTVVHFREKNLKPMILNATNGKAITKLLGTPYLEEWQDKRIVLGVQKVKAFGDVVDAVRVLAKRPPAPAEADPPMLCADCAKEIKPFGKMSAAQLAKYTKDKYGRCLCSDCAGKAAKGEDDDKEEQAE